jgi:SAM-dependent methyltransferase
VSAPHPGAYAAGPYAAPRGARETRLAFERFARWTIEVERPRAEAILPADEAAAFLAYYRDLPWPSETLRIRRYVRGLWRTEAGWVARRIAAFRERHGRAPEALDAGSGFGTHAMLFAASGASVTGVDLRPDRLDAATRRLEAFRRDGGGALPVRYARADLTRAWPGTFDLVWVYNALSHIEPLDVFLDGVREHLRPGGVLVVGDLNGAHPGELRRLATVREEVQQEYVAPDGTRHAYAVERPFPPAELRELARRHGLDPVHHELYLFAVSRLPAALYHGIAEPLQRRWRWNQRLARRQLFVAQKPETRA